MYSVFVTKVDDFSQLSVPIHQEDDGKIHILGRTPAKMSSQFVGFALDFFMVRYIGVAHIRPVLKSQLLAKSAKHCSLERHKPSKKLR